MMIKKALATLAFSVMVAVSFFAMSAPAQTVVVTPTNTQGWNTAFTGAGGAVSYITDYSALGFGALRLTTDGTAASRAQYAHATGTLFSSLTDLSYDTKQISGDPVAAAAYQLESCLQGGITVATCGYTTLNFEPYLNPSQGPVVAGVWQSWDVDSGTFWSTRTVACSNGTIVGGSGGGGPHYTLSDILTACPTGFVFNHYVNIGTGIGAWDVYVDAVNFNGVTYDFEPYLVATNKDQCKNGGWQTYRRADGSTFRNQGDCIQYVNNGH